jgi:hypothetical protein
VPKEVGKALNNYRYKSHKHGLDVPCIGICSWEYTAGTEQLESLTMESPKISNNDVTVTVDPSRFTRRLRTRSRQLVRLSLLTNH